MNKLTGIATGILIFLFLFYNKEPGLNVGLFALAIWFIVYFSKTRKRTGSMFRILSASLALSVLSWMWYGDALSFFALFFACIATVFHAQFPSLNIVNYPPLLALNLVTFPFRVFFIKHWIPPTFMKRGIQKWIATLIIPLFFFILFAFVYSTGSDALENFFKTIFRFDALQIFLLSALAFFILFNLMVLWVPHIFIRFNNELKDDQSEDPKKSAFRFIHGMDEELKQKSGLVSLILLNILLIVFIITYNYEQFFTEPVRGSLSSEIHDRVFTIIVSILLAMALILFYFEAKPDARKTSKQLVTLAGIWLLLNAILVLSALIKNTEYVSAFGLTFKRISVYIFMALCLTGLALSWFKIRFQKTNIFLISRMMWVLYFTLIISAPINFSWIVTQYNLSYKAETDINYLKGLDYNKALLFDRFKNDEEWDSFFKVERNRIAEQKKKKFLSGQLYYKLYLKKI